MKIPFTMIMHLIMHLMILNRLSFCTFDQKSCCYEMRIVLRNLLPPVACAVHVRALMAYSHEFWKILHIHTANITHLHMHSVVVLSTYQERRTHVWKPMHAGSNCVCRKFFGEARPPSHSASWQRKIPLCQQLFCSLHCVTFVHLQLVYHYLSKTYSIRREFLSLSD